MLTIPIAVYIVNPPDDEQQACSKHVEPYYWNKLIDNSASCWLVLHMCTYIVSVNIRIGCVSSHQKALKS